MIYSNDHKDITISQDIPKIHFIQIEMLTI